MVALYALTKLELSYEIADFGIMQNLRKQWGYIDDQKTTTHPIAHTVAHTEQAESIFDGITYAKGASVLRQLMFLVSPERFSASLHVYFKRFAFKNATQADFLACLEPCFEGFDFSMQQWQTVWLEQPGVNLLETLIGEGVIRYFMILVELDRATGILLKEC